MPQGHATSDSRPADEAQVAPTAVDVSGVFGLYACPSGPGPFPGVVAFGGSGGGLGPTVGWAPALASRGFAVLAIAYFAAPGLPQALIQVEVEAVERAVSWLRGTGVVEGDTVGVIGMSRGSELALLASALLDGVGPVVAFAPSGISWSGIGPAGPVDSPTWTFRGEPIPYARMAAAPVEFLRPPTPDAPPLAMRPMFEAALADPRVWRDAEIAVEAAKGPILLVSGEDDAMWPATTMAAMIERRAADRAFGHRVVHLHYPDAGHTAGGVPGHPAETEVRHPLTGGYYALGGTHAGNAAAREDSWPRVVSFLTDALPGARSTAHRS
jgi:dienelactone hydrolase